MRRRVLAVATALTCSAIFLAGPAVLVSGSADDGDAKGKAAGADLFGLTRVVNLHIEISADEYRPCSPRPRPPSEAPAGPDGRSARASGRASGTSSASSSPGRAGP